MRPEQITQLTDLEEKLVDLFVHECKPEAWKRATVEPARQNALKEKKVALATMQLVGRIQNSLRDLRGAGDEPKDGAAAADTVPTLKRVPAGLRKEAQALLRKHGKPH